MTTSMGFIRFEAPSIVPSRLVADRYDHEAEAWDKVLARLDFHQAYRQLFAEEAAVFSHLNAPDILDIGIGTGAATVALLRALRESGIDGETVTGLDLSTKMLMKTSEKLSREKTPFQGLVGDIEEIPLDDQSFDVVLAAHVLEHARRPLKAMAEIDRVLRPGGRAVIMMTRCSPLTISIQKRWSIQCARSRKLEIVLRDFGYAPVRILCYSGRPICNLLSFCCIAGKPES